MTPTGTRRSKRTDILAAIRALRPCGVELSLSTGLWITAGDVDARLRAVSSWTEVPDLVSLNLSEEGWRELADVLAGHGIGIEAGVWTAADAEHLLSTGVQVRRVLVEPARRTRTRRSRWPTRSTPCSTPPTPRCRASTTAWAPRRGRSWTPPSRRGHDIRVGLEDVTTLPDGRRAPDNAAPRRRSGPALRLTGPPSADRADAVVPVVQEDPAALRCGLTTRGLLGLAQGREPRRPEDPTPGAGMRMNVQLC